MSRALYVFIVDVDDAFSTGDMTTLDRCWNLYIMGAVNACYVLAPKKTRHSDIVLKLAAGWKRACTTVTHWQTFVFTSQRTGKLMLIILIYNEWNDLFPQMTTMGQYTCTRRLLCPPRALLNHHPYGRSMQFFRRCHRQILGGAYRRSRRRCARGPSSAMPHIETEMAVISGWFEMRFRRWWWWWLSDEPCFQGNNYL